MKKLFFVLILLTIGLSSVYGQGIKGLISETVTATNDTFAGTWLNIGFANNVVLGISTSDSALIKVTVDYKMGGNTADSYKTYTDSLFTNSATGIYLPLVLRGWISEALPEAGKDSSYYVSMDRIPGANYVRVNLYRHTDNGTRVNAVSNTWRAYLKYQP